MERQRKDDAAQSTLASGVYRAISSQRIEELERERKAASERVSSFRADILQRNVGGANEDLGWIALQEIDTAHEELRVAEEQLHAQADEILATRGALEAERTHYNELFDAAPDAYLVTDLNGAVLEANRRAGMMFNLDPAFLITKPLASFVAEHDRTRFRDLLSTMGDARIETELRIQPRKGEPYRIVFAAQRAKAGRYGEPAIRWLGRTIQEQAAESIRQQAVEDELRTRIAELELERWSLRHRLEHERAAHSAAGQASQHKSNILSEVAHELRSPLASITGWLNVLTRERIDPTAHQRAVTSMTRGVRLFAHLIEQLVDYSRFTVHPTALDPSQFDVQRAVVEVVEDLRPLADLNMVYVRFSTQPARIEMRADRWRLQQIIRNLLGNAIKFTPAQGVIRVDVSTTARQAMITVADTGRGISPEVLASIFQPFVQLGAERRHGGLGLGLSIAQRLAQLHGGSITVESEGLGQGATFRLTLPLFGLN